MALEYRTASGGAEAGDGTLTGLVTPFGVETTIGDPKHGGFRERIMPGAFKKTLQERDVVLVHSHDTSKPLARTSITEGPGSMTLREDPDAGLRMEATPVQTSYGKDVMALAEAKVIRGMSFGFEPIKDAWYDDNGRPSTPQAGTRRDVHEVRLHEVTTTAFPAYATTELSARDAVTAARGIEERKEAPKPYGDVEYADAKNGKYPIDTEEHAKAAWAYINMPKNASEYPMNGVSLTSVKDAIKAALKKFGVQISEENAERLALEFRDFMNPHGHDMAADGQGCSCLAAADASLDEAQNKLSGIDRNTLPPEVNQAIDLMSGAAHLISEHNKNAGTPDPDAPNGNSYDSPTGERSEPAQTTPEIDPEALREMYRNAYGV